MKTLTLLAVLLAVAPARAHELRPAYLEVTEIGPGRVTLLFKQPVRGEYGLPLRPRVPGAWRAVGAERIRRTAAAVAREAVYDAGGPLAGGRIGVDGLSASFTDVLLRVRLLDGTDISHVLKPAAPAFEIPAHQTRFPSAYLTLGVEHILRGADHLLFLLGLLVLVGRRWMLMLKTVSAFTVAHSLTLGAATLGLVRVPAAPLEAAIALSILFLGVEIARQRCGGTSIAIEHPWAAAFSFGLLHGLGFASGLSTLGLSTPEIVAALLLFNVGVELGQLGFVALYLSLRRVLRALIADAPVWAEALPAYVVGSLGAYWTIAQTVALFSARAALLALVLLAVPSCSVYSPPLRVPPLGTIGNLNI